MLRGVRVVTNGDCFKSHTPIRHWEHYILHTDSQISDEMFSAQNEWILRAQEKEGFMRHETCVGVYLSKHSADLTPTLNEERKKSKARNRTTTFWLGLRGPRLAWDDWRTFSAPLLYHLISKLFQRIYSESAYSIDFSCLSFIYSFARSTLSPSSSERETTENT